MKKAVAALLALLSLCCHSRAATVTGTLVDSTGTAVQTVIVFDNLSAPISDPPSTILRTRVRMTNATDGTFSVTLQQGNYNVRVFDTSVVTVANTFSMYVPGGSGTYDITDLVGTVGEWVGEANRLADVGAGDATLAAGNTGTNLNIKSLVEGSGITLSQTSSNVTIAATGGGSLSDGDKGDVTVSDSGTVWNIDAGAIGDTEIASGIDAAKIGGGTVDNTEFGHLNGTTSPIQTQLNGKLSSTAPGSADQLIKNNSGAYGAVAGISASGGDLSFSDAADDMQNIKRGDDDGMLQIFGGKSTFEGGRAAFLGEDRGSLAGSVILYYGGGTAGSAAQTAARMLFYQVTATDTVTERAQFDINGNFGIGKTPTTKLDVNGTITGTAYAGPGTGLTALNASNLSSGTVADARLSANVPFIDAAQNTFAGEIGFTDGDDIVIEANPGGSGIRVYQNVIGATNIVFESNGAIVFPDIADDTDDQVLYIQNDGTLAATRLTDFAETVLDDADPATARETLGANNASNLSTGTVPDAQLPDEVPLTDEANTFAVAQTFAAGADMSGSLIANLSGINRDIYAIESGAAVGAAATVDLADGDTQQMILDEDATVTLSANAASGHREEVLIIVTQDGGGGNTITSLAGGTFYNAATGATITDLDGMIDETGSASTYVSLITIDGGTTWLVRDYRNSVDSIAYVNGSIDGEHLSADARATFTESLGTAHTLSIDAATGEGYASVHYITAAVDIDLPNATAGCSFILHVDFAGTISVVPDTAATGDTLRVDTIGDLDAGDEADSAGSRGDIIVVTYHSADKWYLSGNGIVDGGVAD